MAPVSSTLRSVPAKESVTQTSSPSTSTPLGPRNPVETVVTVQGVVAPTVTFETELLLAVQTRAPSKARPKMMPSTLVATVATAPAAWVGSMLYSLPVVPPPTTMRPLTTTTPNASAAPVQVASSVPSLPRTRETELLLMLHTHRSDPSDSTRLGLSPTVVMPRTAALCVVQYCRSAARRPPRFKTPSTDRERNAAIWTRVTLLVGS